MRRVRAPTSKLEIRSGFVARGLTFLKVNIFSHIVGGLLFLALPIYLLTTEIPPRYSVATTPEKIVVSIWFSGIFLCFLFSAM
jgi:predicted membrane channel-forming protein YqfA (hemolysin III family)